MYFLYKSREAVLENIKMWVKTCDMTVELNMFRGTNTLSP